MWRVFREPLQQVLILDLDFSTQLNTIPIISGRSFYLLSLLIGCLGAAREIHGFTHPIYDIGIPGRLCGQYVCRVNSTPASTLSHLHNHFAPFMTLRLRKDVGGPQRRSKVAWCIALL